MKLVIIAGGKGARLGLKDIPKPMVPLSGKPILQHQIELAKRYKIADIIILSGHLADVVFNYFKNGSDFGVNITHIIEPYPLGTAGSLKLLEYLVDDDFIVFYGDVVMDLDIQRLVDFHNKFNPIATLVVHPNDHPKDSDLLEIDDDNKIVAFYSKPHTPDRHFQNLVNAAVYIFSKEIFKFISFGQKLDFGEHIFPLLIKKGEELRAYRSAEYIKDIGTKERLKAVEKDVKTGKVTKLNQSNPRGAIFLDRDGVVNYEMDNLVDINDFKLIPRVTEAISKINSSDYLAIVITNQPVIAKGFISEMELWEIHKKMETLLGEKGAYLNDIFYCPHHPDKGFKGEKPELKIECNCRKPKTGLIDRAVSIYNIDLGHSFLIGDSRRDFECGKNAGVTAIGVETGCGCKDSLITPNYSFYDLYDAVTFILERN